MRVVAIASDGDSEYVTLPTLLGRIRTRQPELEFLPVAKLNVDGETHPDVIAKACRVAVLAAVAKSATDFIVLLDREGNEAPVHETCARILAALNSLYGAGLTMRVILKNSMYENWLVSDLVRLRAMRARFDITPAFERKVSPNKADSQDALSMLKKAAIRTAYDKVSDSKRIMEGFLPERAAQNSRSFRHFLHVLGDPDYQTQCRRPA